jgi:hypothetical protein
LAPTAPRPVPPRSHGAALELPATRAARLKRRRLYIGGVLITALAVILGKLAARSTVETNKQLPAWLPLTGIAILWLLLLIHSEFCTERHQYQAFLRRYPWTGYCAWFAAYHGPTGTGEERYNRYICVYLFDLKTGERIGSLVTERELVPWARTDMTVWLCGDPETGGVLAAPGGGGRLALAMPDVTRLAAKIDRLPLISLLSSHRAM